MEATAMPSDPARPELRISRIFDAPRDLMFRIWTEPRHLVRWWAPHDFTVPLATFDATPGGRLRIDFRTPDGFTFPCHGDVLELSPPERLVFTTEYREKGKLLVVSHVTASFSAVDARRTRVDIHAVVTLAEPEAADSLAGMEEGWNQQIDKLEAHAAHAAAGGGALLATVAPENRPFVVMRRAFAAPRPLVWSCFADPERLGAWWSPADRVNRVLRFDLREGGGYRIRQTDAAGGSLVFSGEYLEIRAPERLVNTFAMEGPHAGNAVTNTQVFEEAPGGTLLTVFTRFASVAERDAAAGAMATGAALGYSRLDALLRRI